MEQIKTGVIGLGRMGKHHCRVYANQKGAQLVGVYDIDPLKTIEISTKYEIPGYQQVEDLLEQVDAVTIATPTPTHFELVRRCLDYNVHVLVEKPVTETLENAEELARLVDDCSLIVQVGHIERFNPTFLELKKVMESIKVLAISFRRLSPYKVSNKDVDVVLDLMVHDLDLCLDLTSGEPASISAYGLMPFSDSLDHVVAQLFYCGGPLITLTASRVTEEKIRAVEVTCQEAFIEADFLNKNINIHRCSTGEYFANNHSGVKYQQESLIQRILVPNSEPLELEINHFLACISNHSTPCVSIIEGLNALRLAQHIRNLVNKQNLEFAVQALAA